MNIFRQTTCSILLFSIAFLIYSCSKQSEKKEEASKETLSPCNPCPQQLNIDSLTYAIQERVRQEERRNIFMSAQPEDNPDLRGGAFKTNYTFSENTKVYSEPDTNSLVLKELPFASQTIFLEGVNNTTLNGVSWRKIQHPDDYKKAGYIRNTDLADYYIDAYDDRSGFLVAPVDIKRKDGYTDQVVEIRRYRSKKIK